MMFITPSMTDPKTQVREDELKIPALLVLAQAQRAKIKGITRGELADALESISLLSEADREVTGGDRISRFRRQVFNLISHGTLEKEKLVVGAMTELDKGPAQRLLSITPEGRARLAKVAMAGLGMPTAARPPASATSRTLEKAIAMPALYVLANLEAAMECAVPMTTFRTALRSVLPKSPEDLAVLKNRSDTRIDQVIRNLISHNTLEREGWVKRDTDGLSMTTAGYSALLDYLIKPFPVPAMFEKLTAKQAVTPVEKAEPELSVDVKPVVRRSRRPA